MMQARLWSLVEVLLNVGSGFILAWVMVQVVYDFYGLPLPHSDGFTITVIFTVVSMLRSYFWRRLFNKLHRRLHANKSLSDIIRWSG